MDSINSAILLIDSYFGSSPWFPALLLGKGIFFTIYLKFPQIIFFKRAWKILFSGNKYKDKKGFFTLSKKFDLKIAASNLYKTLRLIRKQGYKKIQISKIPCVGPGIAINDRIKRASKS